MHKQRIKFDFLVHDLKVPLAVIEAGVTALIQKPEKYGPLTDRQLKVLRRILRNTMITRSLVNDALELGRSSEGIINRTTFRLSEFVKRTLVEVFDLTDHEVAEKVRGCASLVELRSALSPKKVLLHMDEGLWGGQVCMDENKLRQIARNLLSNALKYRKQQVDVRIAREDGSLTLTVKDDGEGIPADFHKKIFECYFQMDMHENHCVRGHGLGLAGVMVLVEDMGGELILESDVGRGATFSVILPE
ncbi:MAG: sensor histidine kinase [Deltaproteobacteria bacterium]|nr:sensor histidine kinase [Deltaproteobacteria bacterium]MBW2136514.1 sensor histidine kinase [Deltaproteobacteria bacterium]